MTIVYLDANVFAYASISQLDIGERSRSLVRDIEESRIQAVTSSLTFDELVWVVKKFRGQEAASEAGATFLNMAGLEITDVNVDTLAKALQLINKYRLDPRDSIHAASAILADAKYIISDDSDFDKVSSELKRRAI